MTNKEKLEKNYVNSIEAQKILGVDKYQLHDLVNNGAIQFLNVGKGKIRRCFRFRKSDLVQFLEKKEMQSEMIFDPKNTSCPHEVHLNVTLSQPDFDSLNQLEKTTGFNVQFLAVLALKKLLKEAKSTGFISVSTEQK